MNVTRDLLRVATEGAARLILAALVLACAWSGSAWAAERVVVEGDNGQIARLLEQTLNMPADTVGDPQSIEFLDRVRIERDRLTDVLHGFGYYAAQVEVRVGNAPLFEDPAATDESGAQSPGLVTFVATPGPMYSIRSFRVVPQGEVWDSAAGSEVAEVVGRPATAETLAIVESEWRSVLRDVGHPFAAGVRRSIVTDDGARVIDVVMEVVRGPVVRLGEVRFLGLLNIDPAHLQPLVGFKPGERFQAEKLVALQTVLEEQPEIESVQVHLSTNADASGAHPVTVTVVEAPVKGPAGPIDGLIGIAVLGAMATSVAVVQVSRARTGDSSPWRTHWYIYLIGVLLVGSAVMVGLRVVQFLG